MKIFFDETGEFSFTHPAISLTVGLVVPDRACDQLFARFREWRQSEIGLSKEELKGSALTYEQISTFVETVFSPLNMEPILTVVGADTAVTAEGFVTAARNQLSQQYSHLARLLHGQNPPNLQLSQAYKDCAGWIKKRSSANFLWIAVMEAAIYEALQLMVCAFVEQRDDEEFEQIELSIDRSFIKEPAPIQFWIEYIRNARASRAKSGLSFMIPNTWRPRQHPYVRKYKFEDGISDISDLIRNHMKFVDSKKSLGVQIADICAHIIGRFHRGDDTHGAYTKLEKRIVGREGAKLRLIHFDQTSLSIDPENLVRLRSFEQQKAALREINKSRNTGLR